MIKPLGDDSPRWYIWTARPSKVSVVKEYIENNVKGVSCVLCPTKDGDLSTSKATPLYAGYMFLKYAHNEANPTTWLSIKKHPFVVSYIGPCADKDINSLIPK